MGTKVTFSGRYYIVPVNWYCRAIPLVLWQYENIGMLKNRRSGDDMHKAKKLLTIIREDRKLLATFSGTLVDGIILISVIIMACCWFLP